MSELFAFDDFFVDANDPGVEHDVTMKDRAGNEREVKIRTKRAMSLGDREAAKAAATTSHVDPTKGVLVVDGFDQGEFTIQLLARSILSWPFERVTRNEAGEVTTKTPVPVTVVNVRQLMSENADALATLVNEVIQGPSKEALAPFEKPSDEAS
jgi:hypothetical protein